MSCVDGGGWMRSTPSSTSRSRRGTCWSWRGSTGSYSSMAVARERERFAPGCTTALQFFLSAECGCCCLDALRVRNQCVQIQCGDDEQQH